MTRRGAAALMVTLSIGAAGCASSHRAISPVQPAERTAPTTRPTPTHPTAPCSGGCLWARQGRLDHAADYATRVAGAAHVFTGVRVDVPGNKVVVQLTHAPQAVIAQLQAAHPGVYVIRNGAPRTWHEVVALQKSIDWSAWKAKGVRINQTGPTQTGYLQVGVSSNVARAQALFDAMYGRGVVRVFHAEPIVMGCACGRTGSKR